MAKKKKGKSMPKTPRKPNLKSSSRGHQQQSRLPLESYDHEAALFSLADEAKWASNHRSRAFAADSKLRYSKVEFISAGLLEGTIKETAPAPPALPALPSSRAPASPSNETAMAKMTIRGPSPSPSISSSEDEVVFRGRGNTPFSQTTDPSTAATNLIPALSSKLVPDPSLSITQTQLVNKPTSNLPVTVSLTNDTIPQPAALHSLDERHSSPAPNEKNAQTIVQGPLDVHSDVDSESEVGEVTEVLKKRLGGQSPWMTNTTSWESKSKPGVGWLPVRERPDMAAFISGDIDPREAAYNDYVDNIKADVEADYAAGTSFARRDLDIGADSDQVSFKISAHDDDGWTSDILQDLDNLSTSSDVVDTIERIISTRTRSNGKQYLVLYQGSSPDDAHWLPASFFKSKADQKLVMVFEAEYALRNQQVSSSSDDESDMSDMFNQILDDDDEDEDENEDEDDEEAEDYDDERLARILQRQEELGLGSGEVLLFGGDEIFDGTAGDVFAGSSFSRPSKKRQARVKGPSKRSGPSFPSASAMADALDQDPYNGFDVMDTERPSLRPRKKGRRGQMPPELSDSDLNEQLQASWEADRVKKRLKKAEREELRKLGLLGRKGKAPDLSVKFKDGIEFNDIIEEIREFMFSDLQTLQLPPMEAPRRAVIHQMVHQLGVNSKSRGDGVGRFTVLSKTSRTRQVDDAFFDALIERKKVRSRFEHVTTRGPGRKTTRPVVSYRDGETVGASAPELGAENKGRKLLEKMGWSKGMALGALDNKGILQPIAHTVKTNKAGLQ